MSFPCSHVFGVETMSKGLKEVGVESFSLSDYLYYLNTDVPHASDRTHKGSYPVKVRKIIVLG